MEHRLYRFTQIFSGRHQPQSVSSVQSVSHLVESRKQTNVLRGENIIAELSGDDHTLGRVNGGSFAHEKEQATILLAKLLRPFGCQDQQ